MEGNKVSELHTLQELKMELVRFMVAYKFALMELNEHKKQEEERWIKA
ncbi:hypothetical protein [Jeotgalibacillus proteolyticus]|nr:hypothetical protein [Jeotgalibacillus proteolyticus]